MGYKRPSCHSWE